MALDFEVNFEKAISGVQAFHANLLDAGRALDKIEAKSGKAFARTKMADGIRQARLEIEGYAAHFGEAGQRASQAMGTAEKQMLKALGGISNGYFNAALKAKGWADKSDELHNTLSNTARLQSYAKWQSKIATLHTEAAGQAEYLRERIQFLNSAEGKASSVLAVKARAAEKANTADAQRRVTAAELKRELIALDGVVGRSIARMREEKKGKEALIAFDERQAQATKLLVKQIEHLATAKGQEAARRASELKGRQKLAAFTQDQANALALLTKQLEHLGTAEGQEAARRASELKGRQKLASFTQDQANALAMLTRQIEHLSTAEGQEQARREAELKGRKQLASFLQEQANKTALLAKEVEFLGTAEGQAQVRMAEQVKGRRRLAGYLDRQRVKMAELRAEAEFLASAEGEEAVRQAVANQARREAIGYLEQQRARMEKLRQEAEFLASAEGQALLQQEMDNKARRQASTFLERQRIKTAELTAELEFLQSAEGKAQSVLQGLVRTQRQHNQAMAQGAQLADGHVRARERMLATESNLLTIARQVINAEREMALTGEKLAWGYERLTQAQAAHAASQERARAAVEAANKALIEGEQALHRYTGANAKAEQAARRLADEEARSASRRKATLDELKRAILERDRADKAYQATANQVAEATRKIGAAEARTQAERQRAVAGTQAYNESLTRAAHSAREAEGAGKAYWLQLRRVNEAMLTSSADRLNQQFVHLAASGRDATKSLHALTRQEAAQAAGEERATRLLELRNRLTLAQARASEQRSGSEARLTREMERQIAVAERRNRLMAMSTAELLGLSNANRRASRSFNATNQAASMLRAGLNGLHTSIGMYAGSTILLASATYALAAALRSTVSVGMEFTETMSRAEAIMMTGTDALTEAGRSMASVEGMVRALGASTMFTATEVSGGLVDLGMAGLSASEAMTGLAPALNLAAIGAISMSESADIATNVMTAFGMEARDLGEVVDVMATAVTNSNTNVQQLANALTYVGPAAAAAGFSLRDTIATIEVLSNSGIKASKAGTGLRRFMLNVLNPGDKARAVMEKYGISIDDAAGNTRTMTDILGQFHEALNNDAITPAERTAAVMDLVGVRAHSAVSRMISAFDEFSVLRRQLEEVEGAAEKMRETMEDNLTADWKMLKSAFQDVQLEVFDAYDDHLRTLAANWTDTLAKMQLEIGKISLGVNDQGVEEFLPYNGVDVFIARIDQAKDAVLGLGAAFLSFKAAGVATTLMTATSVATQGLADRMGILNARTGLASVALTNFTMTLKGAWGTVTAHTANIWYAGSAYSRLTAIAYTTTAAVTGLMRALAFVAPIAGWVGVIVGAGYALKSLFGNDTQQRIRDHHESIERTKTRYEELQEAIKETTRERMRLALVERRAEARKERKATLSLIEDMEVVIKYTTDEDSRQRAEDRLFMLRKKLGDLDGQIADTGEALSELTINQAQHQGMVEKLDTVSRYLAANVRESEALRRERERLANGGAQVTRRLADINAKLKESETRVEIYASAHATLSQRVKESTEDLTNFSEMADEALKKHRTLLEAEYRFDNLSDYEKLNALIEKRATIQRKIAELDLSDKDSATRQQQLQKELVKNEEEIFALEKKNNEERQRTTELYRERAEIQANEEATLERVNAKIAEVQAKRQALVNKAEETNAEVDHAAYNAYLEEENRLYEERNALLEKAASDAERLADKAARADDRAADKRKQALEKQKQAVQALLDEMYPLRAEQRQYREELALLSAEYARLITVAAQAAAAHGVMSDKYLEAQAQMMLVRQGMSDYNDWRADQAFEEQRQALEGLMDDLYPDQAKQREYLENVTLLTEGHGKLVEAAQRAADTHGAFSEEAREARGAVFDLDDALGKLKDSLEDKTDIMDEFAKNAAQGMQQHFADFLFDPFAEGLDGMLEGFTTLIKRLVAEAVAADLTRRLFGANGGGSGDGWVGAAFDLGMMALGMATGTGGGGSYAGGNDWASAVATFDGGGFTGWGARAGGVDGKGGFMAMLHPNETVVDHTKGGVAGTTQTVTNNFILEERKDRRTQNQLAVKAARGQRRAIARFGS